FGEPLGFVVDATRADGVDVAPVAFLLRVLERIAVHLGRRRQHESRALLLRQPQRLVGPERPDLERRNRQLEIVDRARRTGPVEYGVHRPFDVDVVGDVVFDEEEVARRQVGDVRRVSGEQVVDADDRVPAIEERFGQVRPDEARGAGDDYAHQYACFW